jgi:polysaccharide export outer membrane protein
MLKYHDLLNPRAFLAVGFLAAWACVSGCASSRPAAKPPVTAAHASQPAADASQPAAPENTPSMALREGDHLRIAFPGSPTLDTTQTIRRDGKITLDMAGEMKAAGLTPHELEQQILKAYDNQLTLKQVSVVVQSSVFIVYVTGAVMHPGKIVSDRVETPLEVVIEAGIDQEKANLKKVVVIRENDNGRTERFFLNLDALLKGRPAEPFILKPMDKIFVPEKLAWF